jgi:hypothetical protein
MLTSLEPTRIDIDPSDLETSFNRIPFGFSHDLHRLDLFSPESLRALATASAEHDYFVAGSAPRADTDFYTVEHGQRDPAAALDDLTNERYRILIKRPETFDARFRALLDATIESIVSRRSDLRNAHLARLESAVLISSPHSITPFHFDPETSFFFQIEGDKNYHLFPPDCVFEPELERFYKKGIINIGQLDLGARDPRREHTFALKAGKGLHQPYNAPHWVETVGTRSVSYVIAFETEEMHASGRTRAFNHYLRKTGLRPKPIGVDPRSDALKARVMQIALPLRRRARGAIRKVTGR